MVPSDILDKLKDDKKKLSKLGNGDQAINLYHLRSFTNGDSEQEETLFGLFNQTLNSCLGWMQDNIDSTEQNAWHDKVHQLKGAAANLGAEKLAGLCKRAENVENPSERELLLKEIETASEDVLEQIESL
jgi:HPt (histidine-containing phosphotransfer) domain-containing protein